MLTPTVNPSHNSRIFNTFQKSFRDNVHQLMNWGYTKAHPKIIQTKIYEDEEPDITSYIVEAIQDIIDFTTGVPWISQYSAQDNARSITPNASGKGKSMPDITIEFCTTGPHPKYFFEAKRLRVPGFTVNMYTQKGGMDCFTSSQYAADCPEAAMLGYIQSHSISYWEKKLKIDIANKASILSLTSHQRNYSGYSSFPNEWISEHSRSSGRSIDVYHILLDCIPITKSIPRKRSPRKPSKKV